MNYLQFETLSKYKYDDSYYKLIETIPNAVYFFIFENDTPIYEFANSLYLKLYDITEQELIDNPLFFKEVIVNSDSTAFNNSFNNSFNSRFNFQWKGRVVINKKPYWFNIEATVNKLDENVYRWIIITQDITDQKKAQKIINETESMLQGLLDNVKTVAVQGYNMDGTVIYWNKAAEDFYGYSKEEAIGNNLLDLIIPDQAKETVKLELTEMITKGTAIPASELNLKRKDNSIISVYSSHSLIEVPEQGMKLFCIDTDLSKIKKTEQANRSKTEFLANMSHEIRTPLNAIVGLTHLLRKTPLNNQQISKLNQIDDAGRHLLSIINDILDLSKIEAGQIKLYETDFNLSSLVDVVTSLVGSNAREKNIDIIVDFTNTPLDLYGDVTRIRQSLLNYVGNSIKFTEFGSVTIRTQVLEEINDELLIKFEVIDTGIGIEKDKQQNLFKPFEQVENSYTRKVKGTGLGLAITKRLAIIMGGDAGVNSEPGVGSNFWFTLKLKRSKNVKNKNQLPPVVEIEKLLKNRNNKSSILLAEDNIVNREVAKELLEIVGLDIEMAENGRIAVEKANNKVFDLILMDIQMPEMDGIEATKLIYEAQKQKNLKTPIIAMTANVFDEGRQDCINVGMVDFIPKPVDPAQLYSVINKWLPEDKGKPPSNREEKLKEIQLNCQTNNELLLKLKQVSGLNIESGLNIFRNNTTSYYNTLKLFIDIHKDDAELIQELIEKGNLNEAERTAHAIKGTSGNIGATKLHSIASELNLALKHRNITFVLDLSKKLIKELTKLISDLESVFDEQESETKEQCVNFSNDQVKILIELKNLLDQSNSKSNKLLQLHKEEILNAIGSKLFSELKKSIEIFDYEHASNLLKNMVE